MPPEEPSAQEENQHSAEKSGAGEGSGREFAANPAEKGAQAEIPDVTLDVPELSIEEAKLQVDNLRARISLQTELADMMRINVGVDTFLEKVELELKGLGAQALLKANLENVRDILGRTLESLDNNPQLVESLNQQNSGGGELEGVAGTVRSAFEKPEAENPEDEADTGVPEEGGEAQESEAGNAGAESAEEVEATDAARSKAEDLGLDLAQIEGTGSGGRIIARDVQRAAKQP
ncbi:MAG: E3 binding domain-containing protein [Rubrobacteraceae bacterium]